MSTRIDYAQIAAKLDYAALEKKLEQLAQRQPPKSHKTAGDVLEPLREKLLALHAKGWSSNQLADELKAAGVPVSPARLREYLNGWTNGYGAKPRARRRNGRATTTPSQVARTKSATGDGQTGLRLTGH